MNNIDKLMNEINKTKDSRKIFQELIALLDTNLHNCDYLIQHFLPSSNFNDVFTLRASGLQPANATMIISYAGF